MPRKRILYEVYAGNVGCVYFGHDRKKAKIAFDTEVDNSKSGYGRVAGEAVTIFADGEIKEEYEGTLQDDTLSARSDLRYVSFDFGRHHRHPIVRKAMSDAEAVIEKKKRG